MSNMQNPCDDQNGLESDDNPFIEPPNYASCKKRKYLDPGTDPNTDDFFDELDEYDEHSDCNVLSSKSNELIQQDNRFQSDYENNNLLNSDCNAVNHSIRINSNRSLLNTRTTSMTPSPSPVSSVSTCPINYQNLQQGFTKLKRNYDFFDSLIKIQVEKLFDFQNQIRNEREELEKQMKIISQHLKVIKVFYYVRL